MLTVGGEGTAASSGLVRITSANGGTAGASGRLAFSSGARGGRERRGGEPGVRHVDGRSRRRRGRERGRRDERVWGIGDRGGGSERGGQRWGFQRRQRGRNRIE